MTCGCGDPDCIPASIGWTWQPCCGEHHPPRGECTPKTSTAGTMNGYE